MTAAEWIGAFCDEIGMPAPSQEEMDAILRLAAVAAHASERIAAPIACFVAGASGRSLAEAEQAAEGLATGG
jgi:Domain of unknown function (DUF6457)